LANPTDDSTTSINVKYVSISAWNKAKSAAALSGEMLGSWISRACERLADAEAERPYLQIDGPSANPVANPISSPPPVDLQAVAAAILALSQAGLPVQKRVGTALNARLHASLKEPRQRQLQAVNIARL